LSLSPYYFRDRLGGKPAILLAFLLACDPGFLGLSRLADGPVIAICSILFAWGAWRTGSLRAAGVWAGIALLSGPFLWPGLLGLAVTYALLRGFFVKEAQAIEFKQFDIAPVALDPHGVTLDPQGVELTSTEFAPVERKPALTAALYAAGTYFLLGSFFLLTSGGLSAGLASIPAYFGGWLDFSDVPFWRLLLGLAGYEGLAVLLAIAGLVRGILKGNELTISLGVWLAVTLVLALAYPSRQVADLAWVMIPLLALAAGEVSSYLNPIKDGKMETIGMAIFTATILTLAGLNYAAIAMKQMDPVQMQIRWWVMLGLFALLLASIVMVAFGWSIATALQGGLWGGLLVLGVVTISSATASAGLRTYRTVELWSSSPLIGQSRTLINQMNDLSRWKAGMNGALDVNIVGFDSPALQWALRDWPLTVSAGSELAGTSSIIITSAQFTSANIETAYRGQDLTWRKYPAWNQGILSDWLRWSFLHEFPSGDEKLILWVRSDVFIDWQNNP
jgi:hypothetical protein